MKLLRNHLESGSRTAVMLLRRSTSMQDKSIPEQREFILGWARTNGYSVVGEYVDDAVSGDGRRAAFERLLLDLEKPDRPWSLILAFDRARYTRADIYEAATYADRILKAKADVVYCAEGKSLSTDHEIVWAVETYQKHEVLKQTSRDTLRGMLALARKGFWCGGPVPYGYDAEIVDKLSGNAVRRIRMIRRMKTRPDGSRTPAIHQILDIEGKLIREVEASTEHTLPLKSEAELTRLVPSDLTRVEAVREIFQSMADRGMGFKSIARTLNDKGIPSPGGHGLWRTSAVKAIAHNPIYRGVLEWNSRTEAKYNFIQNGTMVPKPRSAKSQVFLHEERDRIQVNLPDLALVSPELWHRAHAGRSQRADLHYRERNQLHAHSPLGGKIVCGQCGAKMYASTPIKTKMVGGKPHTYVTELYVCSTYLESGVGLCSRNGISRPALQGFILSKIRDLMPLATGPATGLRQRVRARLESMFGAAKPVSSGGLKKRLSALEEKVLILERLESRERSKIGQEAAYHEAKSEIARISQQLRTESASISRPTIDLDAATEEVVGCLSSLENFDRLPPQTQKSFFGKFVNRVVLDFGKERRGKRSVSILQGGLLELVALPPSLESSRLDGSGGGI
jgi:DNA invertase Pin-like site-specific DNA recombinase